MTNRTAIVTGASRGIGAAVARRLAGDGVGVVVNYAGSAAEAERVAAEIGGLAVQADVSDPAAARRLFDAAEQSFGGVDILVNNAGILPPALPSVAETDDSTFDRLVAVNLKGSFNMMR